jgi:hypothetical protein
MKTQTDNGGPAFPRPASEYEPNGIRNDGRIAAIPHNGMTLRDYFAAAALQGICANLHCTPQVTFKEVSQRAYDQADAMLAARKEEA